MAGGGKEGKEILDVNYRQHMASLGGERLELCSGRKRSKPGGVVKPLEGSETY